MGNFIEAASWLQLPLLHSAGQGLHRRVIWHAYAHPTPPQAHKSNALSTTTNRCPGTLVRARFADLHGGSMLATPDGALLLTDDRRRARRIAPEGTVSTLAGGPELRHLDGPAREGRAWADKNQVPYFADSKALNDAVDSYLVLAPSSPETHLQLCQPTLPFGKATDDDEPPDGLQERLEALPLLAWIFPRPSG